jgi:hypothetical protein
MKANLYWETPNFKSGPVARFDLLLYAQQLARPHVAQAGVFFFALAHDAGCPLEQQADAPYCTCAPTIDLHTCDHRGRLTSVRLLEDGIVP